VGLIDLVEATETARSNGWYRFKGSVDDIRNAARRQGWSEVANRRGGPLVSTLRPTTHEDSRKCSLSAIHGLGPQPLHTDGAHHRHPPRFIFLVARQPNPVPTLLHHYRLSMDGRHLRPQHLRDGVFVVRSGKENFYTTASLGDGVRFDPGCMTPCDQRSRAVKQYFADLSATAFEFQWSEPDLAVLIDNYAVLHGRGDATGEKNGERTLYRMSFSVGTA